METGRPDHFGKQTAQSLTGAESRKQDIRFPLLGDQEVREGA